MKISGVTIRRGLMQIKQLFETGPRRRQGATGGNSVNTLYQPVPMQAQLSTLYRPVPQAPFRRSLPPVPRALPSLQPLVDGFYANGASAPGPAQEIYSNNTDAQINADLDNLQIEDTAEANTATGPLAVAADLKLYEDFLALDNIGFEEMPDADANLRSLSNPMYLIEKNTSAHKSGYLLHQLMWYYKQNFFFKPDNTVTFTTFITTLSEPDIAKIWQVQDDGTKQEYIRRFKQGVRYLAPEKQEKYNVYVKNGKLRWAKWGDGKSLDTTTAEFYQRKHAEFPTLPKDQIAIWVMSRADKVYTHAAKIHRFHHSSFTSGDAVRCAGDWEVKDGKLLWISAASGHYKPSFENLRNAVQIFANKYGISANTFGVKLFRKVDPKTTTIEVISASKFLFDINKIAQIYQLVP